MATQVLPERLTRIPSPRPGLPVGTWWPLSRRLGDSLDELFTLWPPEGGRISRVLYSPPDWDDHPRSVPVADRWVKTGCFPDDDTHELILTMSDGKRLRLAVIPPDTPAPLARRMLSGVDPATSSGDSDSLAWENEGGHG
jgi:hypothetical protein